jgi:magnesium transporter
MVAGIYGVNFDFMPELKSPWGYPLTLAGMFAACAMLYAYFRHVEWL